MDDDSLKEGAVISGLKVVGSSEALPTLVPALGIDQVIITIADAPQVQLRRILSICEGIPVRAQMIPAMDDLLQGRVSITQLREVRVEDLLHRETVSLEEHDLVGFLGGKVVMVTGAGGSIGAELARQVARFSPSRLLLVERSEPALYTVDRELCEAWPSLSIAPVVGDVCDRDRMLAVFRVHRPQVVAHAAAHKHVPLMETGSVIPLFREQIARGGPVTITHPEMKRYFMTIPEAAVLTLQAGAMGHGGKIFVLDMGEPVHILDLAKRMIELSEYRQSGEIAVVFTGVRPGEKRFEELQYSGESIDKTLHAKIGKIAGVPASELAVALSRLRELASAGSADEVRAFLGAFLPEAQLNGGNGPAPSA